jgi:prevent-host-death family protein
MNVSVRELKGRRSEYLRRLQQGEVAVITHRGEPVGRIDPIEQDPPPAEADVVRCLR